MRIKPKLLTFIIVIAIIAGAATFSRVTNADTASELQAKIDAQNAAISALNAEIASYQNQLDSIGKNKTSLANTIKALTVEANKLKADISVTQSKINANNLRIQSLGNSIVKTQAVMADLQAAVAKSIRNQYEHDTNTLETMILTKASFADLWQSAAQEASLRDELRAKVKELVSTKNELIEVKSEVEIAKSSLVNLAGQLNDQKTINQRAAADKNSLLKETKSQEAAYQKLLANKVALKNQMEQDMRDYEAKLKYVLDPSSLPAKGSAALAWPLDKVTITQLFGKTADSGRLYASGTHNGIDFGVATGTPVYAMAGGVIVGSGNTDATCPKASYGRWLYIKYDNGLSSLYAHLSLIKSDMQPGTRVTAGQIVGYTGSSGYATGPHLHLTIIAADAGSIQSFPSRACNGKNYTAPVAALNAYLDPMLYLPKK